MALLLKQLFTRSATMYRPALVSGRFLSIKGVRDCDRGFESRGFNGGCDVRGLTTRCSYAVATGRFVNISGVHDCDRGYGFNGCHDTRGFTTKIYNDARTKSFYDRFFNISGVRDCDRGYGFNGCHDVCGFATKIYNGARAKSFYAVATGRFVNISGVHYCVRGYGFNGYHDTRGFTTKIYNDARTKSFYERFMNRFKTTRSLSRLFRLTMTASDPDNTSVIDPHRLQEDAECLRVHIHMITSGPEHVKIIFDDNTVFVEARSLHRGETFICWFELPDIDSTTKIYKASDIKAVLRVQLGWIELIIPKLKEEEMVYDVDIKTISEGD